MNLRIFTAIAMVIVILSLVACSDSRENDDNVVLLNKDLLEDQKKASDNGYCPLLPYPYDPRIHGEQGSSMSGSMLVFLSCINREEKEAEANSFRDSILPGGKPYLNSIPDFSYCDNFSETESDSLQKVYDAWLEEESSFRKEIDAWQEEVWKVRGDPARNAILTFSKGQTIINLSPVFVEVDLNLVRLRDSKKNDTLYIKAIPGANGSYGRIKGMNSCPISLDFALNYIISENVKVLVFEEEQIFQVKRQ